MASQDRSITIYIPAELKARMQILPPRSISKTCQEALIKAVERAEQERTAAIAEAFGED